MKDFKTIYATNVIADLIDGKKVYACILDSDNFESVVANLSEWPVRAIAILLKEENVAFFEKVEG